MVLKQLSTFSKRQILTLVVFSIADFCNAICVSLQAPFYPQEAEKKGATATEYGLVFGVFELVVFLISPFYGRNLNTIGPKCLFNGGIFTTGICAILFGFLDKIDGHYLFISLSFIIRIVEAMGNAAFLTASFAIIAKEFPDNVATTFASLETFFGLGLIVGPTVGGALYQLPNSEEEWISTGKDFENRWNFPNCGGAIDGKHIRIKKPPKSGLYFYNYKGYCSIVLMAIVNADYEFIYVNVGCNGRISDGGVIECTGFYTKLLNKSLNLPLNNANKANLNFVFVADDAFALHENILKPYPQRQLTYEERIFNYRLSRARRIVENAFGILSSRFRIFHTEINMNPEKIDFVVLAACVLHNFLRKEAKATYMPANSLDVEDIDYGEVIRGDREENQLLSLQQGYNKQVLCENAKNNRDNYKNYFVGDGAVSWQDKFVNKH